MVRSAGSIWTRRGAGFFREKLGRSARLQGVFLGILEFAKGVQFASAFHFIDTHQEGLHCSFGVVLIGDDECKHVHGVPAKR
jgi:hypothetical protein